MIRNNKKNFGKSKSAMQHQKLHGKLSEYVVLTIQTVSAAFYEKQEIATYKGDNLLNKRTEIINTCRHRSTYKQVFIVSVLLFKKLFPLYVAISYFSFKHKRRRLLFGL